MKYFKQIVVAALLLSASPLLAAGTPNSYVTPQTPTVAAVSFTNGSSTPGTIYTGATNGSKCFSLMLNWNDQTTAHLVTIVITHGSVTATTAQFTTTTGAAGGTYATPINLMSSALWPGLPSDASGNSFFYLASGDTLKATYSGTITTSDLVTIYGTCGDF